MTLQLTRPGYQAMRSKIRNSLLGVLVVASVAAIVALAIQGYRASSDPASRVRRSWARHGVDKPNVIVISLDTTRADHLGSYGYAAARTPATDALAHAECCSPRPRRPRR